MEYETRDVHLELRGHDRGVVMNEPFGPWIRSYVKSTALTAVWKSGGPPGADGGWLVSSLGAVNVPRSIAIVRPVPGAVTTSIVPLPALKIEAVIDQIETLIEAATGRAA